MPPFVRKVPLRERIQAYLNPYDFMLWLSEEIETRDWNDNTAAFTLGPLLNMVFFIARSNTSRHSRIEDDVFGSGRVGTGWFTWLCSVIVSLLSLASVVNATFTFLKRRHYRLFERPVDLAPSTPSAQRVKVESSPASPLHMLQNIVRGVSAESRAHPDATSDVWEVAIWDPSPACLQLFCLFSPGHVFVYWLFLPLSSADPFPSTTIATLISLELLLTAQLLLFKSSYHQKIQDTAIIKKEVLNEYDTKFVHPRMQPRPSRDVGTQFTSSALQTDMEVDNVVETYRPTTNLRRAFYTNPNPNYAKHVSPDNPDLIPRRTNDIVNPFLTPLHGRLYKDDTPLRTAVSNIQQPNFRSQAYDLDRSVKNSSAQPLNVASVGVQGDGGSLGVYNHTRSPLKRATSIYDLDKTRHSTPTNSLQAAARELSQNRAINNLRSPSPVKGLDRRLSGPNARTRFGTDEKH